MSTKEIETLSSKIVYSNKWMKIREDQIKRLDGSLGLYGVVDKPDYALIIPKEDNYLVLVEQYRYPVEKRYWEFPQGSWEESSIEPEELAKAELKEETGLIANSIMNIGYLYQSYGHSSQGFNVFLALGLEQKEKELEIEEQGMISKRFSINEIEKMIIEGIIKDNASISAFCLARLKKLI
jgi:ADP-ribose pyrophosphatase